jgi:hypothetical protein
MKANARTPLLLSGAALLVAVGLALFTLRGVRADAPARAAAPRTGESAPGAPPPDKIDRQQLAQVEALVAAHNAEAGKQEETFRKAGWTMVSVPPPDEKLVHYDPALLDARERELRMQLASTVPGRADVAHVAEIARRARLADTRFTAVDALGRVGGVEAQSALIDLLLNGNLPADDDGRRAITPLIRPTALDDPMAATMARLLDSPKLTPVERQQMAFTLALVGMRDGMTLDPSVLDSLTPGSRALIDQMKALAQRGIINRPFIGGRP